MANLFYVNWYQNGNLLEGYANDQWITGQVVYPINFPGNTTDPVIISIQSSSLTEGLSNVLTNVCFYLTGTDVELVQSEWPYIGNVFYPVRPELNGGLEISFDGINWIRFNQQVGYKQQRSTWLTLSKLATGGTQDGVLNPFDVAQIQLRYVIPPGNLTYKVLDINLAISFEVT